MVADPSAAICFPKSRGAPANGGPAPIPTVTLVLRPPPAAASQPDWPPGAHGTLRFDAFMDSALMHYVPGGTGTMVRTLTRWIERLGE